MTQIALLVIIFSTITALAFFQVANAAENNSFDDLESETSYVVGRFFHSQPLNGDQIFMIHHKIINGSLIEIQQNVRDAGFKFNINSMTNGTFQIDIPRNYPYSNEPWFEPFVIINGDEMVKDIDYILEEGDCFYKFTIYFSSDSLLEIAFSHIPERVPFISEDVSSHCIEKTIVNDPSIFLDLSYMSPLEQFKSGKKISEIQCKYDLYLIERSNEKPACMKPESVCKLSELNMINEIFRSYPTLVCSNNP